MAKTSWKPYIRKGLFVMGLVLIIALLFVLKGKQQRQVCSEVGIEIVVPHDMQLLTEFMVQDLLLEWYEGGLVGLPIAEIDLADIEKRLSEQTAVASVEVSMHLNGILEITIDQRIPIVRIYQGPESSYYLDYRGGKIPAKGHEPARVPVATGSSGPEMIEKIYTLACYVQENQFAEALVEQIFVSEAGALIVIPKVGSHQVILGNSTDLDIKFHKLETFYKEGLNAVGWDKYKSVDLSFANQIVCK